MAVPTRLSLPQSDTRRYRRDGAFATQNFQKPQTLLIASCKIGAAAWHESGRYPVYPTHYPRFPNLEFPSTFVPNSWRDDLIKPLGFVEKQGWMPDEAAEMYSHHSQLWRSEFPTYDIGRLAETKGAPHWYLAPLCVKRKYWGRGVGKALIAWGIERADEQGAMCVLECMPRVRPLYYRFGFVETRLNGECKETQLVRPARGEEQHI